MDYFINPVCFSAVFTVPTSVVDNHLKFANPEHLKVLLYILRNMDKQISVSNISKSLGINEYNVNEALLYWTDAGILSAKKNGIAEEKKDIKKTVTKTIKPSRIDAVKRGFEDPKIMYMLRETQLKLGRNLKSNETSTLVWLYEDEGLDVSLILLIIQYAVNKNKTNIRFIESVALDWINKGIDNIIDADNELRKMAVEEQAWNIVSNAFGIEKRKPSKKEIELSVLWIEEWKISKELLVSAYEECVNAKSKFVLGYVAKIIENWYKKGYKNSSDIEKNATIKEKKENFAAYDIDLFEKMINSKD